MIILAVIVVRLVGFSRALDKTIPATSAFSQLRMQDARDIRFGTARKRRQADGPQ